MPCSICGNHGHNIRTCDGAEFLKDIDPNIFHIRIYDEDNVKVDMEVKTEEVIDDGYYANIIIYKFKYYLKMKIKRIKLRIEEDKKELLRLCNIKVIEDTINNDCINIINKEKQKEKQKDIWLFSKYENISKLESNNVGVVGEKILHNICKKVNIRTTINGLLTKQIGGGIGDGTIGIDNNTVEIKTARQGNGSSNSFQHELGEYPWKSSYMVFIDISPMYIYLTIFRNWSETFYKKSGLSNEYKCEPYFPSRKICWRKKSGNYKLDTTILINENNVKKKISIKITNDTTYNQVKNYINSIIN